ncbi:helix-turn-helix domain-containing protein [Actinokineospora sp. HUAS TT18]|uniref:helix-turn-helix domain-containing protein n=1 Tax=Actinokineospora sp. HUAS TT18 TaxID=3447451 RepID=UPI003F524B78
MVDETYMVGDKPPHWNPAQQLSHLRSIISQLPDLDGSSESGKPRAAMPRRAKQLKGERALALIDAYVAGASTREVAERFGIHRLTVSKILKAHGVEARKRRLTKDEIDLAVNLYEQGMSQATIAERIGASPDGIRNQLLKRGVKMRGPHDWHSLQ